MPDGDRTSLKTGVKVGGGTPPGYEWNIYLIEIAVREGHEVLGDIGYEHMAFQFRELARSLEPTRSQVVDVRPLDGDGEAKLFEIRDRGCVFGEANVRVLFGIDRKRRAIVPLTSLKKQNNGKTPKPDLIRAHRRWRKYRKGDFGMVLPE